MSAMDQQTQDAIARLSRIILNARHANQVNLDAAVMAASAPVLAEALQVCRDTLADNDATREERIETIRVADSALGAAKARTSR